MKRRIMKMRHILTIPWWVWCLMLGPRRSVFLTYCFLFLVCVRIAPFSFRIMLACWRWSTRQTQTLANATHTWARNHPRWLNMMYGTRTHNFMQKHKHIYVYIQICAWNTQFVTHGLLCHRKVIASTSRFDGLPFWYQLDRQAITPTAA